MVDQNNKKIRDVDSSWVIFFGSETLDLVHAAVVNQLASRRTGTAATKNKALVSGGGKKPWKQKGTGRARAGSSRSPLWRHGGTCFGPMPRDYSYSLPKKAKRARLIDALASKVAENKLLLLREARICRAKDKINFCAAR